MVVAQSSAFAVVVAARRSNSAIFILRLMVLLLKQVLPKRVGLYARTPCYGNYLLGSFMPLTIASQAAANLLACGLGAARSRVRRTYSRSGELGNYVLVRLVVRVEEGGHSLQGARDLGSGGARHRGRVGVGDVLGRLVGGVVLERRGLLLGRGRRRRLRLQGLVGVLRLSRSPSASSTKRTRSQA